ncbi:MAG: hypothetical protein E6J43_03140, partial [Chloroflexi bacterium]
YHWTLTDTRKLEQQMAKAKTCFVIGAGFISLLTVSALIKVAPLNYTVVELEDQVMPQLLDATGGEALERGMREKGIEVILGDSVSAIEPSSHGSASQSDGDGTRHSALGTRHYTITLGSGKSFDADMIVCGTGVRPNVDFLSGSEVKLANGVVTNERQETNVADVYAAGDCAETHDFLSGERVVHAIWPTAIAYPGSLSWNVTELFGLASASVGEFRDRPGLEPIVFHNAAANIYRKLLLDGDHLVGAVVIGRAEHIQDLGVVQAMIRRKTDISKWKHMLGGERINYGMLAYETIKR